MTPGARYGYRKVSHGGIAMGVAWRYCIAWHGCAIDSGGPEIHFWVICALVMPMTDNPELATSADTRDDMTRLAGRGYSQYRHILVQLPDRDKPRRSTLGKMLSARRHRELLLYMLVLTCWPWLEDNKEPLASDVWIRALTAKGGLTWSSSTLSRAWTHLEELGLIRRKREDKLVRVIPRREDAGEEYTAPGGRDDRWNAYFTIPDSFWKRETFAKLSFPGLVMLLVIAKETQYQKECWLTYELLKDWYGVTAGSAQNGVADLDRLGLLHRRVEPIKASLSKTGGTTRTWYSLTGDYGHDARAKLRARAKRELTARAKHEAVSFAEGSTVKKPKLKRNQK